MLTQLALVFPGQGSQAVGMLADIAQVYPEIKAYYDQASSLLNYDLWQMIARGPAAELDKTIYTQPAVLVGSYAIYQILLKHQHIKASMLAGHSLGEYTALLCAQAFTFTDAVRLVAARGQYMQDACPPGVGAMAAIIGLTDDQVKILCLQVATNLQQSVAPANYNSIGQIVIAGHHKAVAQVMHLAKKMGAKLAVLIPISVAAHCELMHPAAKRLEKFLLDLPIQIPTVPVINNVDVKPYTSVAMIRERLMQQLYSPVRWVETILYLQQAGMTTLIECGPGKILTGLNKRIAKSLTFHTTHDLISMQAITAT